MRNRWSKLFIASGSQGLGHRQFTLKTIMAVGVPSCIQLLILARQLFHGLNDGMPIALSTTSVITENCTARGQRPLI